MKKVSVIIIGYNVENTIGDCIVSVINQTYKNMEVIFVDDGSTDNTNEIVKQYKKLNVKYIYQNNKGANSARKTGFLHATGDFCLFIDGDDMLQTYAIEIAVSNIVTASFDFLCFDYNEFYEKDIINSTHTYETREYVGVEYLESILERRQAHFLWNKLYKTEFLKKIDFLNIPSITMGDDFAANIRMGIYNPRVIAIKEKLYLYRKNINSVSRGFNDKYIELLDMMQDVETSLDSISKRDFYKDLVDYNYYLNFYYYVVRNKYKYGKIQHMLYKAWKERKINLNKNKYIRNHIKNRCILLQMWIYIVNVSDYFQRIIANSYYYVKKLYLDLLGGK